MDRVEKQGQRASPSSKIGEVKQKKKRVQSVWFYTSRPNAMFAIATSQYLKATFCTWGVFVVAR